MTSALVLQTLVELAQDTAILVVDGVVLLAFAAMFAWGWTARYERGRSSAPMQVTGWVLALVLWIVAGLCTHMIRGA